MPENALQHVRQSWSGAFLAADVPTFDAAVRNYMRVARDHGIPMERLLARLKSELASLTPIGGDQERASQLAHRAVDIVIREYYNHQ